MKITKKQRGITETFVRRAKLRQELTKVNKKQESLSGQIHRLDLFLEKELVTEIVSGVPICVSTCDPEGQDFEEVGVARPRTAYYQIDLAGGYEVNLGVLWHWASAGNRFEVGTAKQARKICLDWVVNGKKPKKAKRLS